MVRNIICDGEHVDQVVVLHVVKQLMHNIVCEVAQPRKFGAHALSSACRCRIFGLLLSFGRRHPRLGCPCRRSLKGSAASAPSSAIALDLGCARSGERWRQKLTTTHGKPALPDGTRRTTESAQHSGQPYIFCSVASDFVCNGNVCNGRI